MSSFIWRIRDLRHRPQCASHQSNVLLCWCGYLRPDQLQKIRAVADVIQESEQRTIFDKGEP